MTTKLYDLSQLFWPGSAMWPRLAFDVQAGAITFGGIRSTSWHDENHPGWYDMHWPYPYMQNVGQPTAYSFIGHLHAGTHVDAPVYCIPSGITADKIPLEKLCGNGVVIDMRHKGKWDKITADDLEKAKPKIKSGDFVVINTGWHEWLKPNKGYEYYHYYPGLVPGAAEWLVQKKVKAVAGTWPVCDHSLSFAPLKRWMPWLYQDYKKETGKEPGKEFGTFEGCLTLLLKNGITCIQNAGGDIDQVTGQRCDFHAFPFRLEDTDGAYVRLVALMEE